MTVRVCSALYTFAHAHAHTHMCNQLVIMHFGQSDEIGFEKRKKQRRNRNSFGQQMVNETIEACAIIIVPADCIRSEIYFELNNGNN